MVARRNLFPDISKQLGKTTRESKSLGSISGHATKVAVEKAATEPVHLPCLETHGGSTPLRRFEVVHRSGKRWSYPYSHLGLIESPNPTHVTLHCLCRNVSMIEIKGKGLSKIIEHLTTATLQTISETDHPKFSRDEIIIEVVQIQMRQSQERQQTNTPKQEPRQQHRGSWKV